MRKTGLMGSLSGRFILIAACAVLFSAQISAEPVEGESASLNVFVAEALHYNPLILKARAEWEASKSRISQASSLPDPRVGYSFLGSEGETRVGSQEDKFFASQKIPFPWKLWERRKAAHSEAAFFDAKYEAVVQQVKNDVTRAYYNLFWIDSSIRVVNEVKSILGNFEQVAQARYTSAEGSQRDVAKAQTEFAIVEDRLTILNSQRKQTVAKLNHLLGRNPARTVGAIREMDAPQKTPDLQELLALALEYKPAVRADAQAVEQNRRKRKLAQLEYIPDVTVGFDYTRIEDGKTTAPDDGEDSWMIPISVNLPIWQGRLASQVRESKKTLLASEEQLEETKNRTLFEVQDAYYRMESALKLVQLYETALVPRAKLALNSDKAGYESGHTDFLDLLDSERVYLDAQLSYYRALSDSLKSFSDLERAVGIELAEVSP